MKLPDPEQLIEKLYHEIEKTIDSDSRLIGIPAGGHLIVNKIIKKLGLNVPYGLIDGSFYRDDLDISGVKLKEKTTNINFDVENKKIILIDDVFYTGRTTRAAINEIFDYGRPKEIKLYVLIDRNQNELPIKPTFSAYEANQLENSYINLEENNGKLEFRIIKYD
ncbi:MAG: bifunctional pyr operon transcriptional regulator/uracil phosphoribosyltransferase PyrR [Methylophilaceae bacterium]